MQCSIAFAVRSDCGFARWPQTGAGSDAQSLESLWLKIVAQWVFLLLYLRVLQVAYNNNYQNA